MATYYLIDFENVHDGGLKGIELLSPADKVYLFYTANANKIGIDFLAVFRTLKVGFSTVCVPQGKQSLDIHLASFLGSLIATGQEGDSFVIVSKDQGFQNLPGFWRAQTGANVLMRPSIIAASEHILAEQNVLPAESASLSEPNAEPAEAVILPEEAGAAEDDFTQGIRITLEKEEVPAEAIEAILLLSCQSRAEKNPRQVIYRAVVKRFGQKIGSPYYKLIKSYF